MGYKPGADWFSESTDALVRMYVQQLLTEKPVISGTDEMVGTCRIVVRALDGLLATEQLRSLEMSAGICPAQSLHSNMKDFLSNIFMNASCSKKASDPIEIQVVYVADEISSAESRESVCCVEL